MPLGLHYSNPVDSAGSSHHLGSPGRHYGSGLTIPHFVLRVQSANIRPEVMASFGRVGSYGETAISEIMHTDFSLLSAGRRQSLADPVRNPSCALFESLNRGRILTDAKEYSWEIFFGEGETFARTPSSKMRSVAEEAREQDRYKRRNSRRAGMTSWKNIALFFAQTG